MSIETQIFPLEEMLLFLTRKMVSSKGQFLFSQLCDWAMMRAAVYVKYIIYSVSSGTFYLWSCNSFVGWITAILREEKTPF